MMGCQAVCYKNGFLVNIYDVPHVWFLSSAGWTTHLKNLSRGVGREGSERARGREEGHTHEHAVHPASGPHLELDTASPREGRGNFRERKKHFRGGKIEKLSVFYRQ